jgi:DNA-binding MarR family transcriptional regulator
MIASDPNTVGALVARMENCGWIARVPHERDRRARNDSGGLGSLFS